MDMPRLHPLAALLAALALAGGAHARPGDKYLIITTASPPAEAIPLNSDGCNHTFDRAGHPDTVSSCARPSNMPQFAGYYVGGGCVFQGGPPAPGAQQGAWGWDFVGGCLVCPRVALGWCCKYQGGPASYRTDGKPVFNVFGIHLSKGECEAEPECHGCIPTGKEGIPGPEVAGHGR
jgi:hypothetical protein